MEVANGFPSPSGCVLEILNVLPFLPTNESPTSSLANLNLTPSPQPTPRKHHPIVVYLDLVGISDVDLLLKSSGDQDIAVELQGLLCYVNFNCLYIKKIQIKIIIKV